jgi:hypothetical protein
VRSRPCGLPHPPARPSGDALETGGEATVCRHFTRASPTKSAAHAPWHQRSCESAHGMSSSIANYCGSERTRSKLTETSRGNRTEPRASARRRPPPGWLADHQPDGRTRSLRMRQARASSTKPTATKTTPSTEYWRCPLIPDPCILSVPWAIHRAPTRHNATPATARAHMSTSNLAMYGIPTAGTVTPALPSHRSVLHADMLELLRKKPPHLRFSPLEPASRRARLTMIQRLWRQIGRWERRFGR